MPSHLLPALLALALAVGAPPLAAQQPWPVEPGQRVRISSAEGQGVFVVQTVDSGELMLAEVASDRILRVATGSITRLDVSRGPRPRSAGLGRGFARGFMGGALVGIVIGLADGDDVCKPGAWCIFQMTAGEKAMGAGILLGALGGLTGGIIGSTWPGERWQRIAPQTQWTLALTRSGGIAMVASLRD